MRLSAEEIAVVAEKFGVSAAQVRRDHLISLLLGLLSRDVADDVLFFGGTALARTHLPDGRLSEDIDLIVRSGRSRTAVAATIDGLFATGLRRVVGRLEWQQALSAVRNAQAATLYGPDGVSVRIQLLDGLGYPQWPTELRALHQRYSGAPPAKLWVPVRPAFAAWNWLHGSTGKRLETCGTYGPWPRSPPLTPRLSTCTSAWGRPGVRRPHGCSPSCPPTSSGAKRLPHRPA